MAATLAQADLVPLQLVASNYAGPTSPDVQPMLGDPALITGHAGALGYDTLGNPLETTTTAPLTKTYPIWAQIDLDHVWNGLGFSIHTTGDLFASASMTITPSKWIVAGATGSFKISGTYNRWNTGSDAYGDSTGDNVGMVAVLEPALGGEGDLGVGATDAAYMGVWSLEQRGTWFKVGEITVVGKVGKVYLDYRPSNFIGGMKGDSVIYYGFGAAGIVNLDANLGADSDVAFVTYVPEPASLILLALAGLAIRRR